MEFRTSLKNGFSKFWVDLKSYFNVANDLEPQLDAEQSIRSGVSFKGSQLLVLIFAIFIASLGLNTNSIPVFLNFPSIRRGESIVGENVSVNI